MDMERAERFVDEATKLKRLIEVYEDFLIKSKMHVKGYKLKCPLDEYEIMLGNLKDSLYFLKQQAKTEGIDLGD